MGSQNFMMRPTQFVIYPRHLNAHLTGYGSYYAGKQEVTNDTGGEKNNVPVLTFLFAVDRNLQRLASKLPHTSMTGLHVTTQR
jgi:hypothetical protein